MAVEDVKRNGRSVTVEIDAVSRTKVYSSTFAAKRSYLKLMFSKKAREQFVRRPRRER